MSNITITGNVVADPEMRTTANGKSVASFTVVTSKSVKQADGSWENSDTTFWDVKCWGKTAENVVNSVTKGASVIVVGSAIQENWEDKNTGQKRSKIAITAWNVGVDLKRHMTRTEDYAVVERFSEIPAVENDPWAAPF